MLAAAGLLAAPALAAAQGPDLLFQAEGQTLSGTCSGQAVRIEGNHNAITLYGSCASLLLKGLANTVQMSVATGGSIRVEGGSNRVSFHADGSAPAIVALGPDNDVVPTADRPRLVISGLATAPPLPAPPVTAIALQAPATKAPPAAVAGSGPLALTGDDQQRLADCTGRDVTVVGERSAYVLRGGCRSLTLLGDLLAVQAELAPGAKVAVTGQGSVVSWAMKTPAMQTAAMQTAAMKAHAHPPAAIVHGEGSRVQRAETIGGQPEH